MTWKSYVPFSGKMTVRKKLSELEEQAGSLVIVFGVTFGKVIEYIVLWRLSRGSLRSRVCPDRGGVPLPPRGEEGC